MNLLIRWAVLALSFWIATEIVDGINVADGLWNHLWVAALFGITNALIGSLVRLIALPFVILSLGLALIVINAAMLLLVDRFSDVLTIDGFLPALLGSLVISIVSTVLGALTKRD